MFSGKVSQVSNAAVGKSSFPSSVTDFSAQGFFSTGYGSSSRAPFNFYMLNTK